MDKLNIMAQFSVQTQDRGQGISPKQWDDIYLKDMGSGGEGKVLAVMKNGEKKMINVNQAAILFSDPKVMRAEKRSNTGNAPAITGKVVDYVDIHQACYGIDKVEKHHLVETGKKYMVVPIFHPRTLKNGTAFLEFGATWVGGGDYKYTHHAHHIGNMMLYSIQSVVWDLMNEKSKERMVILSDMAVKLVASAKAYFEFDKTSFEIVEPLRDTENAIDMLNRAVAFTFFEQKWSKRTLLRMLEISLKRWAKRYTDFVVDPILGIYGILIAVPILRDFYNGALTDEKAAEEVNDRVMKMLQVTAVHIGKRGPELNKIIWFELMKLSPVLGLTRQQSDRMFEFCVTRKNINRLAPFEQMGILEKQVFPFDADLDGFKIKKQKGEVSKMDMDDKNNVVVTSSNAQKWAGFGLKTPGTYHFRGMPVSGATFAKGNSQGQMRVCNARFLFGNDILPKVGEGKSSAGMHFRQDYAGRWIYDNTNQSLDLTNFDIKIEPSGSFKISQNGEAWYAREQKEFKEPVLMGYKFLKFVVTFQPIEGEVGESSEEPGAAKAPGEAGETIDLQGLSGSALIQQLAKMALKDS